MSTDATHRFVLAHGFTQTSRSWSTISSLLTNRYPDWDVISVDLPGHGDAADVSGDLWDSAQLLADQGGNGTYIGYSMGGRVALHAALLEPARVERLVLIGATAGIDDDGERSARRAADERLADRIELIGVRAFIDEWLTNPLFDGLTPRTDLRQDRCRNAAAGLAGSLRATGTGVQDPLWDRLGDIASPTLVLVGEHDPKFTELGQRLVGLLPHAELVVVPGVGHSVHLEAPVPTVDAIVDWMNA